MSNQEITKDSAIIEDWMTENQTGSREVRLPTVQRTLRVDLHVHTIYSKGDSFTKSEALIKSSADKGVNCVAVSDHNEILGAEEVRQTALKMGVPLTVITAEELALSNKNPKGKYTEVIALNIKEKIPSMLSAKEAIEEIGKQGGAIVIVHPLEIWRHGAGEKGTRELYEICREKEVPFGIEVFNSRSSRKNNIETRKLAERYKDRNVFYTVGSDAHDAGEVGRAVLFIHPWRDFKDLLTQLSVLPSFEGDDSLVLSLYYRSLSKLKVYSNKILKKLRI